MSELLPKIRRAALGGHGRRGIIPQALIYVVLTSLGFVFAMPVLKMITTAVMTPQDQVDPKVIWVPTSLYFENIKTAFQIVNYGEGLFITIMLSVIPAILQTACAALVGYSFARFDYPLKKLWIALVVVFYVVPAQLTTIPKYMIFLVYKLVNTPWALYLPAFFGQGLKSGIFVLIFYQFFRSYPKSLDEAAEIDGSGRLKVFTRIALPMSGPAMVISIIFSVVWYWNETSQASLFIGKSSASKLFGVNVTSLQTLPLRIATFADRFK
jgi:multiple sugar transport system permease protein